MFKFAQSAPANREKSAIVSRSAFGMSMAKPIRVKNHLSNRDLLLIAGIVVALIIVVSAWVYRDSGGDQTHSDGRAKPTASTVMKRLFHEVRY